MNFDPFSLSQNKFDQFVGINNVPGLANDKEDSSPLNKMSKKKGINNVRKTTKEINNQNEINQFNIDSNYQIGNGLNQNMGQLFQNELLGNQMNNMGRDAFEVQNQVVKQTDQFGGQIDNIEQKGGMNHIDNMNHMNSMNHINIMNNINNINNINDVNNVINNYNINNMNHNNQIDRLNIMNQPNNQIDQFNIINKINNQMANIDLNSPDNIPFNHINNLNQPINQPNTTLQSKQNKTPQRLNSHKNRLKLQRQQSIQSNSLDKKEVKRLRLDYKKKLQELEQNKQLLNQMSSLQSFQEITQQNEQIRKGIFDQQALDIDIQYKKKIQRNSSALSKQKVGDISRQSKKMKIQYYRKKMKESVNLLISKYYLDQIINLNMLQIYEKIQDNSDFQVYQRWYISQFYQINEITRIIKHSQQKNAQNQMFEQKLLQQIEERKVFLERTKKKVLLLDMDETLIHCKYNAEPPYDHKFSCFDENSQTKYELSFFVRPFLNYFLEQMSQIYQVVIFTAGNKNYADPILDYIDPKGSYLSYRLYRPSCIVNQYGYYVKDLRIFQNVELEDIVLVDNNIYSFMNQMTNGIPIINFYDDKEDTELLELNEYLKYLYFQGNDFGGIGFNYKYFFFDLVYRSKGIDNSLYNLVKN